MTKESVARRYSIMLRDRKDVEIRADEIKKPSGYYAFFLKGKEVGRFRQGEVIGWVISG